MGHACRHERAEFSQITEWIATAQHPKTKQPYAGAWCTRSISIGNSSGPCPPMRRLQEFGLAAPKIAAAITPVSGSVR